VLFFQALPSGMVSPRHVLKYNRTALRLHEFISIKEGAANVKRLRSSDDARYLSYQVSFIPTHTSTLIIWICLDTFARFASVRVKVPPGKPLTPSASVWARAHRSTID